jgi:hypothetical protein
MTEQEIKAMLDQLKSINLLDMIPQYKELPKANKEAILEAFQILVDKEKARLSNEQ